MFIERYNIFLDVDFKEMKYSGNVTILFKEAGSSIALDCQGPVVDTISSQGKNLEFYQDSKEGKVHVKGDFQEMSEITILFHAEVSKTLMGMHRAVGADGKQMISTQFESFAARTAFPCFDQPDLKAIFALNLRTEKSLDSVSNMPVKRIQEEDDHKIVYFEETPRMSTYLLYIGIGVFESLKDHYRDKEISMLGLKGSFETTNFPLEELKKQLQYFENYFGTDYPLPKLDLISVPDFAAGAMENWGAITFRETALLVNKSTSKSSLKRISTTVAHETAHQWFGDLVTMKWWNDIWLNESFASFMTYKVTDVIHKDWEIYGEMLVEAMGGAMSFDSLESSHPIDSGFKDPDQIAQASGSIVYGKGEMVIRMIEAFLGQETFRKGIKSYIQKFSYSNADSSDLWKSLEDVSDLPVGKVMEAWVKKTGYPYIKVDSSGDKIKLTQQRFLLNGKHVADMWPLPVTIKRSGNLQSFLLDSTESVIPKDNFIKLNAENVGFYRVLYDEESYDALLRRLTELSFLDRWGIASDLFAFFCAGNISLDSYLNKIHRFLQENNSYVVQEISNQYSFLFNLDRENTSIAKQSLEFHRFQWKRLKELNQPSLNDQALFGLINSRLVLLDTTHANSMAILFNSIENQSPELRSSIATAAAITLNDISPLHEKLRSLGDSSDRVKVISAMGHVTMKGAIQSVIKLIDSGEIKKQDMGSYFYTMITEPKNKSLAIELLPEITERIENAFRRTGSASNFLYRAISMLGLDENFDSLVKQVDKLNNNRVNMGVQRGKELLEINQEILDRIRNIES